MSDAKTDTKAGWKGTLDKVKPSKKTLAIVAATAAIILGTQSGVSMDELLTSAEKIAPIVNAIIGVFMGNTPITTP